MKKLKQRQAREVDDWNSKYQIGQRVTVKKDFGEIIETKTRSDAFLLSGHTAVIMLDDISGCYRLDRVQAV